MHINTNTIVLILMTLFIAAGGYWYFFIQSGTQPALTATAVQGGAQLQFKTSLSELQPITFNIGIFSNPNFLALIDLTTPILPEAPGRPDPFAPIQGILVPAPSVPLPAPPAPVTPATVKK